MNGVQITMGMTDEAEVYQQAQESVSADRCRTIAITSGKGGVGKSNMVANLALTLANSGKKVIVLDADLGLANLDVLFGVRPKYTLFHVLQGKRQLFEVISTITPNLKLIAGGSGIANLADMPVDTREEILTDLMQLRQYTDVLLIDTGAGLSANVTGFLHCADEVLLVSTPEPTAMADAYGVIKTLALSDVEFPKTSIVVNRSSTPMEGYGVASRLISVSRQFLKVKVDYKGFVLDDDKVSKAVRQQKPFVLAYPESRASMCLRKIAGGYVGVEAVRPVRSQKSFLDSLCSLFSKK
jgi:flagellar biosynthesis protein FlhG